MSSLLFCTVLGFLRLQTFSLCVSLYGHVRISVFTIKFSDIVDKARSLKWTLHGGASKAIEILKFEGNGLQLCLCINTYPIH